MQPSRKSGEGHWKWFFAGTILAGFFHTALHWTTQLPWVRDMFSRFIWMRNPFAPPDLAASRGPAPVLKYSGDAESVEWFNMIFRKIWRVYLKGIERWLADLLQPTFDGLIAARSVPRFVQRLRIVEFTLDHQAPVFSDMRRRTSRKDSDLNGVVALRYTGGARMLLLIELGRQRRGGMRVKVPVLVSELDLECQLWVKVRLAPLPPNVGTISLAFVGQPTVRVQLAPYNRIRIMRIPILQAFLTRLLTVDLPGMMVLPKRLEINIPPGLTSVAEAAVGRDAVMRAVASAVLQSDSLEHALIAALPLGPQSPAGGVSLPDSFKGELQVTLVEARALPVWGFPWTSNPWCRLQLGSQAENSRRDDDTSHAGRHRHPVWNQEWTLLVEDLQAQTLDIQVRDSHLTGRPLIGHVSLPLSKVPIDDTLDCWLPIQDAQPLAANARPAGELHLKLNYKPFEDDEADSGGEARGNEAEALALAMQEEAITDVKSFTKASSRAAVAATAAATAVAVTKAAAARAAGKAARRAREGLSTMTPLKPPPLERGYAADAVAGSGGPIATGSGHSGAKQGGGHAVQRDGQNGATAPDLQGGVLPPGDAIVAGRSLDEWSERLFPDVSMRVTDAFDADSPYSRMVQDAVETADSDSFSTAVSKLGITARPLDQHGTSAYSSYSSHDDDDYTMSESDTEAGGTVKTSTSAIVARQRREDAQRQAEQGLQRARSRFASRDGDSSVTSSAAGSLAASPVTSIAGSLAGSPARSMAGSLADSPVGSATTSPTASHDGISGGGAPPLPPAPQGDSKGTAGRTLPEDGRLTPEMEAALQSIAAEASTVPHNPALPTMPGGGQHSSPSGGAAAGNLEVGVVDPTREVGDRVLSRAWPGKSPSSSYDREANGSGAAPNPPVGTASDWAAAASQGATSSSDDDGAVAVDTLSPEYMEDLFLEAEAELVATSDDPVIGTPRLITGPNEAAQLPTRGPTTDMSPATGELPVGWHPPKALDTAGEDAGNSRLAKAAGLWNKVSGSAVLAGGVVAENAVGLWGGVKGWTADRLRRSSRDGWESSDEDDDDVLLDQSLDPDDSVDAEERREQRRRRAERRAAEEREAAQYQLPKDLPLEDIAKEMQDSWQLKEDQVERLLESAVAKSERPWLILLSGLATVIVALLIYVGLVVEGRI